MDFFSSIAWITNTNVQCFFVQINPNTYRQPFVASLHRKSPSSISIQWSIHFRDSVRCFFFCVEPLICTKFYIWLILSNYYFIHTIIIGFPLKRKKKKHSQRSLIYLNLTQMNDNCQVYKKKQTFFINSHTIKSLHFNLKKKKYLFFFKLNFN